jgi:hypothetical protein
MPNNDYNIDEDLLSDIETGSESAFQQYSSDGSIDTESLSNQQIAYMSQNPDYMSQMMTDLGITDASQYTKFIAGYDPWEQDIAMKKWGLGKESLISGTREGLLDQLGDPLSGTNLANTMNVEGVGGESGGYLKQLESLDIEGAERKFGQGLEANTLQRDESVQRVLQDYSDYFYQEAGDVYTHQQADKGGGKK